MNYYSHHIGDYRRDTAHLSLLEHGVYRQLLDMYYLSETKIPAETEVVYRRLCAKTEDEKKAVDTILSEFFKLENGWVQTRCDKEIADYQGKAGRARANGKLGGRPIKTKVVISGLQKTTKEKANHKPLTINQEPITNKKNTSAIAPPDGVIESVWADFVELRKSKKAKLTQTAVDGIEREAHRAGWSLENALRECCSRGWTGFKADWVADKPSNTGNRATPINRQEALEARNRAVADAWVLEMESKTGVVYETV